MSSVNTQLTGRMHQEIAPKDIVQRAYITAGAGIVINRVGEKEGVPIVEVTLAPDVIAALNVLKAIYDAGYADRSADHGIFFEFDVLLGVSPLGRIQA